jgi:hypothetical protein
MSPHSAFMMNRQVKNRLQHVHGALRCDRCGVSIDVADAVIVDGQHHPRRNTGHTMYHAACYERMTNPHLQ